MERRKKITNRLSSRNRCAVDDDGYIIEFSVIIQSTELWIELIANECACVRGITFVCWYLSMEKLN